MSDIAAAKSWEVGAKLALDQNLALSFAEASLTLDPSISPVEQLLASIGACFGRSCAAIMHYHGLAPGGVAVTVIGHKPAGKLMDKGLDRVEIDVSFDPPFDLDKMKMVLRDTKRVCTVTNSLSKDLEVVMTLAGASV